MASLPGLVLKIGANTKDAIDGLNKVNNAVGKSASSGDRLRASWKKVGPALGLAGAAAAALAVKIGVDAVQAAMAEEKELTKLNTTLKNLGFGAASDQVNRLLDDLQYATTFTDSDMRPAFEKLAIATGDVTKAQAAMRTTLDLATYSGVSAEAAAQTLAKAFGGNTKALKTMVPGMDAAILKSGDMNAIMGELARIVGGQAAAAAETMGGKIAILSNAVGELQESFGQGIMQGFLDSLSEGTGSLDDATAKLREMQFTADTWGRIVGDALATVIGWLDNFGLGAMKVADIFSDSADRMIRAFINIADTLGLMSDETAEAARRNLDLADAERENAMRAYALKGATDDVATATGDAAGAAVDFGSGLNTVGSNAGKAQTAIQRLQAEMDKFAKNRSIAGQKLSLRQTMKEGPAKGQNLREFGLGVADQASRLASDLAERGNFSAAAKKRARQVLANARQYLGGLGLGDNFTDANGAFLGTPDELRAQRATGAQRVAGRRFEGMATTINYNFGDIRVDSDQAAKQAVKEARRLAALNPGARAALDAA